MQLKSEQTIKVSAGLSLNLRLARESDIPEIANVMKSCADWLEHCGYSHWKVYQSGPDCDKDVSNGKVYCAFDEEKNLVATFTITHESPLYANGTFDKHWKDPSANAKFFKKLAVLPSYHGNGIGKALLTEAEKISRKQGATFLRLDINPNIVWLGDYYMKLGFEHRADLPAGIIYEKSI
jgi:ribosomal protein S18 acetylase RimI-like enzyme